MLPSKLRIALAAVAFAVSAGIAQASTITFSGQDDGASTGGPFPISSAAQAAFLASAATHGPTSTITFEGLATGFYSPVAAAPGVSVAISAPNFGVGFSGINNTTLGNLFGFNTTSGGSQWLGVPGGSATFAFSTSTNSFGVWLTGLQTVFSSPTSMAVMFNDGSSQTLFAPINVNGGAQFFGFTSTVALSSVTLQNLTSDAWGIDDVTYNGGGARVPEPASMVLVGTGLLGLVRRYGRRS